MLISFTGLPDIHRDGLAVLQLTTQVGSLEALDTDARSLMTQRLLDVTAGRHAGASVNVRHRLVRLGARTCVTSNQIKSNQYIY